MLLFKIIPRKLKQKFIEEIKSSFGNNFDFENVPKMLQKI